MSGFVKSIAVMFRTTGAALIGFAGMGFLLGWQTINLLGLGCGIYLTALGVYFLALCLEGTK